MAFADKSRDTAYKNDFARAAYDRLSVIVPKGDKDKIKIAAEAAGESLNAYIVGAIRDRMSGKKSKQNCDTNKVE